MSYESIALLMFATMAVFMFTGQRVFAAIGAVAAGAALLLYGQGAVEMPFNAAFKLFNWFPMLTLPLFVYMGYVLAESGIAEDLYKMMHVWFGRVRGGLAIGTILMMVIISAMNGLSVAGMAIGASIALPEMLRRGYDKLLISGVVQGGSTLGILIPPSVVMVLYGMIAREPVGQLWLAGVFPGLLMAGLMILYIVVVTRIWPHLAPIVKEEELNMPMAEKLKLLRAGIIPFLIFFVMTGLFVSGITSLVESSAIGATGATLAALAKRRLTLRIFHETVKKTLAVSCMFLWLILAALAFGAIFDGIGAARAIEALFITNWQMEPWQVMIMMILSFIVMGMFLDDTAMLVIVAPLYVPLVDALGYDLVWFGIIYTMTCQIAYITPPFGYNLFLMNQMAPKEITLWDIYKSVTPFFIIMVITIALIMIFPDIALWLPRTVYGL